MDIGSIQAQGNNTIYRIAGNFHQEKIFANFATCSCWSIFYLQIFLSCVNDYIEDMATFTTLAKIYSTEYFCNTKVAGLGKIFCPCSENFRLYGMHTCNIRTYFSMYRYPLLTHRYVHNLLIQAVGMHGMCSSVVHIDAVTRLYVWCDVCV